MSSRKGLQRIAAGTIGAMGMYGVTGATWSCETPCPRVRSGEGGLPVTKRGVWTCVRPGSGHVWIQTFRT
eukprot:1710170-Prymnesium_polylepis.1